MYIKRQPIAFMMYLSITTAAIMPTITAVAFRVFFMRLRSLRSLCPNMPHLYTGAKMYLPVEKLHIAHIVFRSAPGAATS